MEEINMHTSSFLTKYHEQFNLPSLVSMHLTKYFTRKWDMKYVKMMMTADHTMIYEGEIYKISNKTSALTKPNEPVFLSFRKANNHQGAVIIKNFIN